MTYNSRLSSLGRLAATRVEGNPACPHPAMPLSSRLAEEGLNGLVNLIFSWNVQKTLAYSGPFLARPGTKWGARTSRKSIKGTARLINPCSKLSLSFRGESSNVACELTSEVESMEAYKNIQNLLLFVGCNRLCNLCFLGDIVKSGARILRPQSLLSEQNNIFKSILYRSLVVFEAI